MKEIDLSRAPIGIRSAAELVTAVAERGDFAEHHYLEIKGPLDVTAKEESAKVAKFILATSNRSPGLAAKAFGGSAVMIIGVSSSGVEGIPQTEILELKKTLDPFLGPNGPEWDALWVPTQDPSKYVLMIVVDPPNASLAPYICWKDGIKINSGRVYIRDFGATREAKPDELAALIARSKAESEKPHTFSVQVLGDSHCTTIDSQSTLEPYLRSEQKRLLGKLPSEKPLDLNIATDLASAMSSINRALMIHAFETPDERSEEDFRREVDEWMRQARDSWPQASSKFALYSLDPPDFAIKNLEHSFCEDVELVVGVSGGAFFAQYPGSSPLGPSEIGLPSPPKPWGPVRRDFGAAPYFPLHSFDSNSVREVSEPVIQLNRGSNKSLKIRVGDIRPGDTVIIDNRRFVLVRPLDMKGPIEVTWTITLRNVDRIFEGTTHIEEGEAIDLAPDFQKLVSRRTRTDE